MGSQPISVLVLGAGINGVAIARELLLNGVSVCLVDRWDIAGGTTAYSSRLIHGGLRYLEYGDFKLVRESLSERERLLRLAPQFVRPLRLFIPLQRRVSGVVLAAGKFFGWSPPASAAAVSRGMWLVKLGLQLYDWSAGRSTLPSHQIHRVTDADMPAVDSRRFRWLGSYYDAQILFPERFVVAMLEDARRLATERDVTLEVFTYHVASRQGRQVTLRPVSEKERPACLPVSGRGPVTLSPAVIVNATGAWVDRTLGQLQIPASQLIGGTKGSHFLTPNPRLREALSGRGVYAEAADGRPVFLLPFGTLSLVGTTDLPFTDDPAHAVADHEELHYLTRAVADVFPHIRLTPDEIVLHYSGVRPLPHISPTSPASITRRHVLHEHADSEVPVISIVGGKLTTCRSLAEETARLVLAKLALKHGGHSRDRVIPGGEDYPASPQLLTEHQRQLATQLQFTPAQVSAVWQLCGTRTAALLSPAANDAIHPDSRESLADSDLPVRFVRRVIRDEWCCRLGDLVERRLMLLFAPQLSSACLRQLAQLMVDEGRLSQDRVDAEVDQCIDRLRTHFGRTI